jgi:BspA type Leucine rich repeat region (6 copies)
MQTTDKAGVLPVLGSFFTSLAGSSVFLGASDASFVRLVSLSEDGSAVLRPYFSQLDGSWQPLVPAGANFEYEDISGLWSDLVGNLEPVPVFSRALDLPAEWEALDVIRNRPGLSPEPMDFLVKVPEFDEGSEHAVVGVDNRVWPLAAGAFISVSPDGSLDFEPSSFFEQNPYCEAIGSRTVEIMVSDLGFSPESVDASKSPSIWTPAEPTTEGVSNLLSKVEGLFGRDSFALHRLRERLDSSIPKPEFDFGPMPEGYVITGFSGVVGPTLELPAEHNGLPVLSVAPKVFAEIGSLVSVKIPEGYLFLGESVFDGCSNLENVELPASLKMIGPSAFEGCKKLNVPVFGPNLDHIGRSAFDGCFQPERPDGQPLVLPASITTLGARAFSDSGVTSVDFEGRLDFLTDNLFRDCVRLVSVSMPEGMRSGGICAFSGCSALMYAPLPESVTQLGSGFFEKCASLESMSFPQGLKEIPNTVMEGCVSLKELRLPDKVDSLEIRAFRGCSALQTVTLPEIGQRAGSNMLAVRDEVFAGCTNLSTIKLPASLHPLSFVDGVNAASVFKDCPNLYVITNGVDMLRKGDRAKPAPKGPDIPGI